MAENFLAEIRIFSFGFAPRNWAQCNGQLLGIAQNQALFSILGTTYGGNGTTNFALPNLCGRGAMHWGNSGELALAFGQNGGAETHTLTAAQLPQHVHSILGSAGEAVQGSATGGYLPSYGSGTLPYASAGSANGVMNGATISGGGNNQPHYNMQPYLVLNICIALQGIFPPRS